MTKARVQTLIGIVVIALAITACGSSSKSSSSTTTTTTAAVTSTTKARRTDTTMDTTTTTAATGSGSTASGGGSTPGATVTAFATAVAANDPTAVCATFLPAQQAACKDALTGAQLSITGFHLGQTATKGDRALVVIEASQMCSSGSCTSNQNPTAGLPTSDAGFDAAYAASAKNADSTTVTLRRVDGTWYIALADS